MNLHPKQAYLHVIDENGIVLMPMKKIRNYCSLQTAS